MNSTTRTSTNPPPVSPRYFYAVKWPCGVAVNANTGRPMRRVARFTSVAARDEWVYQGNAYRTSADYREPVSCGEVQREIRYSARVSPTGNPFWEADPETEIEFLL